MDSLFYALDTYRRKYDNTLLMGEADVDEADATYKNILKWV